MLDAACDLEEGWEGAELLLVLELVVVGGGRPALLLDTWPVGLRGGVGDGALMTNKRRQR